jgi:glycerol-3-phosphate acyltransferase PlsY
MALMATVEYYDATEIATRILPHLVVLTIDPDGYNSFVAHIPLQFILFYSASVYVALSWFGGFISCVGHVYPVRLSFLVVT